MYLVVHIAVQGHPSTLTRFSYQAHLLVGREEASISGTIRWGDDVATEIADPRMRGLPAGQPPVAHRFSVIANTDQDSGNGVMMLTPLVSTFDRHVPSSALGDGKWSVTYLLPIPLGLLGLPLTITAAVFPGGLIPVQAGLRLEVNQVAGPRPVTLTASHPTQNGVDFVVAYGGGVK